MTKQKTTWIVTTAVGVAGEFSSRAAARELVIRIKDSGSVPAAIRIERKVAPKQA